MELSRLEKPWKIAEFNCCPGTAGKGRKILMEFSALALIPIVALWGCPLRVHDPVPALIQGLTGPLYVWAQPN